MAGVGSWPLLLVLAACASAPREHLPLHGLDAGTQVLPLSIVFSPALSEKGDLLVTHESGWVLDVAVNPSGVDLHMPAGPANLRLRVGDLRYELAIKVVPAIAGEVQSCVWLLPN